MLRLFRKKPAPPPPLVPHTGGRTVYAIGDIHGRLDLLDRLLGILRRDVAQQGPAERPILVFLGDYVDRGPDSRNVLERIRQTIDSGEFETIALMGNHERAMLNFLIDPFAHGAWLNFGGRETITSFGATPPGETYSDDELIDCAAKLESLAASHLDFLRRLKLWHVVGNYLFVHAGIRPGMDLDQQVENDLLWIRGAFLTAERHGLPYRVVHGHTPEPAVRLLEDRISVDTGAYASDVLSAVRIRDAEVDVLDTNLSRP
jgi:serine/threonine protein phosphatase 1